MKKALLAATLLFPLPGVAMALDLYPYYTRNCWKGDSIPTLAILDTKDGALLWNGDQTDWGRFQTYLSTIPNALREAADKNLFITVDEKMPHRKEILATLAKYGLTLHRCKKPGFKPLFDK